MVKNGNQVASFLTLDLTTKGEKENKKMTRRVKPHYVTSIQGKSLVDAFERFIKEKSILVSNSTISNYKISFRVFMRECGYTEETLTTEEIIEDDLLDWVFAMREQELSESSINHYMRDMRVFLYWCMDNELMMPFRIEVREAKELPVKLYTDEELEVLLTHPSKSEDNDFVVWRTWAIVAWVLATANRCKTICNVRMKNVNFDDREIVLEHTKNRKTQTVPLSTELAKVLREYINIWRADAKAEDYLFCNIEAEKLTENALKHSFARYCINRGVSRTSLHSLRHNFAKGYVRAGGNMYKLQEILGHSSLSTTRRYVKLFTEDLKEDYDAYSTLDKLKSKNTRKKGVRRAY